MILLIDNYDSFVHNLARYFAAEGQETRIIRNDAVTVEEIRNLNPLALVLSPGPCTPQQAGICIDAIRRLGAEIPILGVCLGHQAIADAYGGRTTRAPKPVHGRASLIRHDGDDLFSGLSPDFSGGRYHSLCVEIPDGTALRVTARTTDGIIMALRHESFPVYGVQFHPESVLTDGGIRIIRNFITIAQSFRSQRKIAA